MCELSREVPTLRDPVELSSLFQGQEALEAPKEFSFEVAVVCSILGIGT